MKLIKISLLSLAVLNPTHIFAADNRPADTGAAKFSKKDEESRSPLVDDTTSFPTLTKVVAKPAQKQKKGLGSTTTITDSLDKLQLNTSESPTETTSPITESDIPKAHPSELPTIYKGLHADISTKHGDYRPRTFDTWQFPGALTGLKSGSQLETRMIEKAAAEAFQYPSKFDPVDVAQLPVLVNQKNMDINLSYWGDMNAACLRAKEEEAGKLVSSVIVSVKKLQAFKKGEVASLEGYGKSNGSGRSSPIADYGMGPKFDGQECEACLQAIAKAFEIKKREETSAYSATGGAGSE